MNNRNINLGFAPTTVFDPNRLLVTNQYGYAIASTITVQQLLDIISTDLITASNGLNKIIFDIRLGGMLSQNTSIQNGLFNLELGNTVGPSIFINDTNNISIGISDAGVKRIIFNYTNGIDVLDDLNNIGFRYDSDYSINNTGINYNGNWIPPQSWNDSVYIPLSQKGQPNGVASLDILGKVPVSQLPNSIMEFKGNWDALNNIPVLIDGTGDIGDVYRVSIAGNRNLGSGIQVFSVGDFVMYNGTIWQNSPSVNPLAVTGPAFATDNAIVRWDGTSGKIIQNSAVTIDDTNGHMHVLANWRLFNTSGAFLGFINETIFFTSPSIGTNLQSFIFNTISQTQNSNITDLFTIQTSYNQSGTAGTNDLLIRRNESSIGSGEHNFIQLRGGLTGSTVKFRIDYTGSIFANGSVINFLNIPTGSSTDFAVTMDASGNLRKSTAIISETYYANTPTGTITDWNSLPSEGLMHGSNSASNSPIVGYFTAFNARTATNAVYNNTIGFTIDGRWFVRNQQAGTWGNYRELWDSGNSNISTVNWTASGFIAYSPEGLRIVNNNGYINFMDSGNTIQSGYLQFNSGGDAKLQVIVGSKYILLNPDGGNVGVNTLSPTLGSFQIDQTISPDLLTINGNNSIPVHINAYNNTKFSIVQRSNAPLSFFTNTIERLSISASGTTRSTRGNVLNSALFTNGNYEALTTDGSTPSYGFHIEGVSGLALYHLNGTLDGLLRIITNSGADYTLLHNGNVFTYAILNQNSAPQVANAWIGGGGETLKIGTNASGADNAFIGFYPRTATPNSLSARIGYTTIGATVLSINNDIINGGVNIFANGANSIISLLTGNAISMQPNVTSVNPNWNVDFAFQFGSYCALRSDALVSYNNKVSLVSYNGTIAAKTPVVINNILGLFKIGGYYTSSSSIESAIIQAVATENWSGTAAGTQLGFYVTPKTTLIPILKLTIEDGGALSLDTSTAPTFTASKGKMWGANGIYGSTELNAMDSVGNTGVIDITNRSTVSTTDATVTTLYTFNTITDRLHSFDVVIFGRRTGGSAGTNGDGLRANIKGSVKNTAGVLSVIATTTVYLVQDQSWSISFSTSGTQVLARVTGAVNNNITWTLANSQFNTSL